jgi:hypothetical protein
MGAWLRLGGVAGSLASVALLTACACSPDVSGSDKPQGAAPAGAPVSTAAAAGIARPAASARVTPGVIATAPAALPGVAAPVSSAASRAAPLAAPPTAHVAAAAASTPAAPVARTTKPAVKAARAPVSASVPAAAAAAANPAPKSATSPAAPPRAAQAAAAPALDLKSLESRLKATSGIGVFTKITIKNQVDDLLKQFRSFYKGELAATLAQLRQSYDQLVLKVLALLQDADPPLAVAIAASRESIWGVLSDRSKFSAV